MKKKIISLTAILLGVVNIGIGIGSVVLSRLNGVDWLTILADGGWILALSMTSVAVLIALRRPDNPLGWIFYGIGFFQGLVSFALQYAMYTLVTSPGSLPGGDLMSWLGQVAWFPGLSLLMTYTILLYPTGTLPSARWRIFGWACILPILFFFPLALSVWPNRGMDLLLHADQIQLPAGIIGILATVSFPLVLVFGIISLISLILRYRKADITVRRQIKWVAFAAGLFLLIELLQAIPAVYSFFTVTKLTFLVLIPASIALPAAVGMAILRYRLWEIDILINRTLVYVPLTGILAGVYAASLGLLQRGFVAATGAKSDGAIVLTTLILTSTFTPIKNALQGLVDRRFKNPREPLAALKSFRNQIQTIEQVLDRESAAKRFLADSVSALQASSGSIFLSQHGRSQLVSETDNWKPGSESLTIPIGKKRGGAGTLFMGPRVDGSAYTKAEISLLEGVAESLGRVFNLVETV
jgi:hypothetical protein